MKRKIISIITIAVLLACLFTSCGANHNNCKSETQQNVTAKSEVNTDMEYAPEAPVYDMAAKSTDEMPMENTEEYNSITENKFVKTKKNAISTFSADVDTASYTKLKSMIESGYVYSNDAIRIEEMLNYFHYNYKKPTNNEPFGVQTEIGTCPWNKDNKLLSIGLQAQDIETTNLPKSNLVFLLDTSGSMANANKLPLMVQAFKLLTAELGENDRISIVTYAGSDSILLEGKNGEDRKEIVNALEELEASGSTNGSGGINTAYELAEKYFIEGGNNRVILATDGDLNVGVTSEDGLTRLIEKKRKSGIYLSVLGFGEGNYKDNKLEALADNGNGNYNYIDSRQEAKKVLVEEMGGTLVTVAKDVKLQVEFNPDIVESYRLVGYENRMLNTEDFEDDKKDAGEIGAGHQVTALYELVLKDDASSDIGTLNLRYKKPDSNTSTPLSYDIPNTSLTTPSEDFNFACCVAQAGLLLRNSKFVKQGDYEDVLASLNTLDISKDPYKEEFKDMVKRLVKGVDVEIDDNDDYYTE